MNTSQNSPEPAVYTVIGYGETFSGIIDEIRSVCPESVRALTIKPGETVAPTEDDRMLILLTSGAHDGIEPLLRRFRDEFALSLVVSTESLQLSSDACDSLSVVPLQEMTDVVEALLSSVICRGSVNYDFRDHCSVLFNSRRFVTLTAYGRGPSRLSDAFSQLAATGLRESQLENLTLIIFYNHELLSPPLTMKELSAVTEFCEPLPHSVNLIWAIENDLLLDSDTIRVTAIASGPELAQPYREGR